MRSITNRRSAGFSLVELLVVIAIIMVVSAMAIPQILNQIDIYRLRSASQSIAGVMQSARMQAIKDNKYYSVRGITAPATLGNANTPGVFVDSIGMNAPLGSGNGVYDNGETGVQIANNIAFDTAGAHPAFPPGLAGANFNPQPVTQLPSFNPRGMPCVAAGAVCSGGAGGGSMFAYFLRQTSVSGVHWGAITVTAAGRVKTWTYSGTAWAAN